MKREAESTWASERVENALLRERINDVAAEVARLASALEGPDSPIDAILAAETARDRATSGIVAANVNQAKGNFDGARQGYQIGANDQLLTSGDYSALIIAYKNNAPIKLTDVAIDRSPSRNVCRLS